MKTATLPKPIKSKNPVVILRAVIKAIQDEPKRYDQGTFFETPDNAIRYSFRDEEFPACGTIGCVAGWVNTLTNPRGVRRMNYGSHADRATKTLGLTNAEANRLFAEFASGVRPRSVVGPERHAADGIKHIKRFVLKKWGKKL